LAVAGCYRAGQASLVTGETGITVGIGGIGTCGMAGGVVEYGGWGYNDTLGAGGRTSAYIAESRTWQTLSICHVGAIGTGYSATAGDEGVVCGAGGAGKLVASGTVWVLTAALLAGWVVAVVECIRVAGGYADSIC